jgi:NAD(P)-dependent dehydrogenase (short-subunit alcohol dehydrogenase family)
MKIDLSGKVALVTGGARGSAAHAAWRSPDSEPR